MAFCMFYSISKKFRDHAASCKDTPTFRMKKPILQKDKDDNTIKANGFGEWTHFCSLHLKLYLAEYLLSYGILVAPHLSEPQEPGHGQEPDKKCLWNLKCRNDGLYVLSLFKNPETKTENKLDSCNDNYDEHDCDDETHICKACEAKYPVRMKLRKKLLQAKLEQKIEQHLNLSDSVCIEHIQNYVESFIALESETVTQIFVNVANLNFALQTKEGRERYDNVHTCVKTFQNHVKNSMPVIEEYKKNKIGTKKKKLQILPHHYSKAMTLMDIRMFLKNKRRSLIEMLPPEKFKHFHTRADCYVFERDVILKHLKDDEESSKYGEGN